MGAAGSRYQSISDLTQPTQPTQPMNHETERKDQTSTPGTPRPTLCDKCVGSLTAHRVMNIEVFSETGPTCGNEGLKTVFIFETKK